MDVWLPESGSPAQSMLVQQLKKEFATPQTRDQVIAYRGQQRLVQSFEPVPLEAPKAESAPVLSNWSRENGVYLIIGGLGGVGLSLGEYLVRARKARLILTSRNGLPPLDQWDEYLAKAGGDDRTAVRIRKVREIQQLGGEVMIMAVDVSDEPAMREAALQMHERFGPINGIINCGFVPDGTVIDQRAREISETVFAPKVKGTLLLHDIFGKQTPLDFFVSCSSMASIFGPIGQVAYTAAGAFQDAFAHYAHYQSAGGGHSTHIVSINWCAWAEVGALLDSVKALAPKLGIDPESQYKTAMKPAEGVDAFVRIMSTNAPQVLVSTQEIAPMLEHLNTSRTAMGFQESLSRLEARKTKKIRKRPPLKSAYLAPRGDAEKSIAQVWQDLFGLETVGVKDDFFELGGDSLKAMTVSSRIHKELNVKIPIAAFFSGPTIEELAQRIPQAATDNQQNKAAAVIPFAGEKEYYPAAPVQHPLYSRHQKDPGNTYFNIHNILRLQGSLDRERLTRVFKKILKRHEIYRTSFHLIDNRVMQKIHPFEELDFGVQIHEASEENLQETIRELMTPFDLARAPLFRVDLLRAAEEDHILLIQTHLIVIDGTSADILAGEFVALYNDKELLPPVIRYRDYAQWQHDRLQSGELKPSRAYWEEQFKTPLSAPQLPLDFPRIPGAVHDEMPYRFIMDRGLTERLKELARLTGTTMFMIWTAALNLLLYKYSAAEEIVVGSRIACRPHPYLEQLQGKFANTFIFRTRPRPQEPFDRFLAQVKETALEVFKHQEFACEGMEDYNIIFVYNNMNIAQESRGPGGPRVTAYDYKLGKTLHDLAFHVTEVGEDTDVRIMYASDLFEPETIERMKRDFMGIFETITQKPDIPLAGITSP
jgi:NAD(P)-dependent dehydrogenase (short-subunit alcohol dehydrogenase family)/acyl carrier protein